MSKVTPGTLLLRALAIFSAVGMLTAWVVFRAVYAPKEKTRTRGSSSKAQNIASAYAAARAAGAIFESAPSDNNPAQERPGESFRMTLDEYSRKEGWKPREDLMYLSSTKSGLIIEPGFFDDPLSAARLEDWRPRHDRLLPGEESIPGEYLNLPAMVPPAPLQTTDTPP